MYAAIAARRAEELSSKTPTPISVTMPDGTVLTAHKKTGDAFEAWKTSPYDVAASISQGLADSSVVARVTYADYVADYNPAEDGVGGGDVLMGEGGNDSDDEEDEAVGDAAGAIKPVLWDLTRPLVGNVARLELLKFESDGDAKTVFWHSSAHMLGEALEHLYGCRLTIGPPLAGGFYYDSYMGTGGDGTFKEDDYKASAAGDSFRVLLIYIYIYDFLFFVWCRYFNLTNMSHFPTKSHEFIAHRTRGQQDRQVEAKVRAHGRYQGGGSRALCGQSLQGGHHYHQGTRRHSHHRVQVR